MLLFAPIPAVGAAPLMPARCQPDRNGPVYSCVLAYQIRRLEAVGVYLIGGYLLRVGGDVGVAPEVHGGVPVAEHLGDDGYRHPGIQHHLGRRVSEVVEAYLREAGRIEVAAEYDHDGVAPVDPAPPLLGNIRRGSSQPFAASFS
jgi:hypothetical protein